MTFQVPGGSRLTTKWFHDHSRRDLLRYASTPANGNNGWFLMRRRGGRRYFCVATDGAGWEHVSVSIRTAGLEGLKRCPTWDEMCLVKAMFWHADDTVIQYHPANADYRNFHAYTLHLWRPIDAMLPIPDPIMVGPIQQEGAA